MRLKKALISIIIGVSILSLVAGCTNRWQDYFVTYSAQFAPIRNLLIAADAVAALAKQPSPTANSDNYLLDLLQEGRIAQLAGDKVRSRQVFRAADSILRIEDQKAQIQISRATEQMGSLIINDQTISYRLPDYERTFLHHYLALDYLRLGKLDDALVEIRRANAVQEAALAKRSTETINLPQSIDLPSMEALTAAVKNGFQSGYTFLFSALLYESAGDLNDAWIDYQRALEIAPHHRLLMQNILRLAAKRSPEELKQWELRFNQRYQLPAKGTGRVILLQEEGLIPELEEFYLPIPIEIDNEWNAVTISLPIYSNRPLGRELAEIRLNDQVVTTEPLVWLGSLAAKNLEERWPVIITRQMGRLIAKEQLRRVASEKEGDWANIAVNATNMLTEHADTRSWSTLPAVVSVWQQAFPSGSVKLKLGFTERIIPINADRITLVWVSQVGALQQVEIFTL